ncbi:MAG: SMP-30/gluconolactonase/LRE family protein [Candidatus Acidiferrales bacterium]
MKRALFLAVICMAAGIFVSATNTITEGWQNAPDPEPQLIRLDPRLDGLITPGARLDKIADGHSWVEGPAWNREGGFLVFSDIPRNAIYQWTEGAGVTLFLRPSGYTGTAPFTGREPGSNGLAWDAQGRLIIAEHGDRRITRLEPDGRRTVLADRYQCKRFNSPNDIAIKSNGDVYFTDPAFGLPKQYDDPSRELSFAGVYRLRPSGEVTLLTDQIVAPNGIAFSPDEKKLYVTSVKPRRQAWHVFDLREDGTLANGRIFLDATPLGKFGPGDPDGFKVDVHGSLFASGPGAFYIIAPDATILGRIQFGTPTSNVAWGDDGSVLYLTAGTAVYRLQTRTRGATWASRRAP